MKTILLLVMVFLMALMWGDLAQADWLKCDIPDASLNVNGSVIEITPATQVKPTLIWGTPQVYTGVAIVNGTDFRLYDASALAVGTYRFRAAFTSSGNFMGFTLPFVWTKALPANSGITY